MSSLRQTLDDQARRFASEIVSALRSASLEELMSIVGSGGFHVPGAGAPALKSKGGRQERRSTEDITQTLGDILALLEKHPEGLRAEQIREALNLDKKAISKPLAAGIESGALTKTGEKRATTYFASSEEEQTVASPRKRAKKKVRAKRK